MWNNFPRLGPEVYNLNHSWLNLLTCNLLCIPSLQVFAKLAALLKYGSPVAVSSTIIKLLLMELPALILQEITNLAACDVVFFTTPAAKPLRSHCFFRLCFSWIFLNFQLNCLKFQWNSFALHMEVLILRQCMRIKVQCCVGTWEL